MNASLALWQRSLSTLDVLKIKSACIFGLSPLRTIGIYSYWDFDPLYLSRQTELDNVLRCYERLRDEIFRMQQFLNTNIEKQKSCDEMKI